MVRGRLGQRQTERVREKKGRTPEDGGRGKKRPTDMDDYYPPNPIYNPTNKEDTQAQMSRKELDPNYPLMEDTPIVTDGMVQKPTLENKEGYQLEG